MMGMAYGSSTTSTTGYCSNITGGTEVVIYVGSAPWGEPAPLLPEADFYVEPVTGPTRRRPWRFAQRPRHPAPVPLLQPAWRQLRARTLEMR